MSNIVLVEENQDNRLLIKAILALEHEVVEYETGQTALAGLREHTPDLIILDIALPDMVGTEVLQCIRKMSVLSNVPSMALTPHAMSGALEQFLAQRFDAYYPKPIVDIRDFTMRVNDLLSKVEA